MRRLLPILLVTSVALAGCGGDDPVTAGAATEEADATTTPPTGPAEAVDVCADLAASVLDPVEDPGPPDEAPEDAPPDPAEVEAHEQAGGALDRLAATGPDELRADAAALAEVFATPWDELEGDEVSALAEPAERLIAWGAARCPLAGPVWRCLDRGTFRTVGAPIPGPEGPPTAPEDAVVSVDIDPTWERVEVERAPDRVTFAWLDADGLVVSSATAEATDGTRWRQDQSTHCSALPPPPTTDTPAEGAPPVDEDDLPPARSTEPTTTG